MMPVASTDRVSRYTQNVSANQRKLVVTFAIIVFASTCTNMRMPPGGGATVVAPCTSDPFNPSDTQVRLTRPSDIRNPPPDGGARYPARTRHVTDAEPPRHT